MNPFKISKCYLHDSEDRWLEEDKRLSDYNIRNLSKLRLRDNILGPKMQIFLKDLKGKTKTLYVHPNHYIDEVKEQVFKKTGFPADEIRLIFSGRGLEYSRTLAHYKISKESTLHMVLRLRGGDNIWVKQKGVEEIFNFQYREDCTVGHFKYHIQDRLLVSVDKQVLRFNGELLDDESTIRE